MSLILPWPPKELSPNARIHHMRRYTIGKKYRNACWARAKQAGLKVDFDGPVHLWITFFPPDKRTRDDDNLIAAFKAGRDGLALALGINDSRFVTHPFISPETAAGGAVEVRLTGQP